MVLLGSAALFLQARYKDEVVPARQNFTAFPYRLGPWVGRDVDIAPDVLQVLGPGDFVVRDYRKTPASNTTVGLFLAYFPSQRVANTLHSPKHCLPGAGWVPIDSSLVTIALPGREPFRVNRYVVTKGTDRMLVLYWYWAHGRAVTSEYWAKFYLVEDSIRLNRSDGSLIRVATELTRNENANDGQRRSVSFLSTALPIIETFVPR
jgi:EpsI family protein